MKRNLLLFSLFSLLSLGSLMAQQTDKAADKDTDAFHFRDGTYGYRAEARMLDSLAVLEMMGEITPSEAQQKQEKFRKAKKNKQRQKKEKMRQKRKKEKNKKQDDNQG